MQLRGDASEQDSAVTTKSLKRPMFTSIGVATVGVLPVFLAGALGVQLRSELHFGAQGLGLITAVFFGTASATSAVNGRVAERIGSVAAMRLGALLASVSLASIALIAHSLASLLGGLVIGGVANALVQPATNLYVSERVPTTRLGLAFGVKQSAIPAATLLGGLAVPTIALTVGWRWAFVVGAIASIAVAAFVVKDANSASKPGRQGRGDDDASIRPLILLGIGAGLGAGAAGTLGSFLVSSAVSAGIGEGAAGLLASLCSGVGLITRLASGVRADRRAGRHLATVSLMMAAGSLGYFVLATELPPVMAVGAVVAFALGWGWPGLFNLAVVKNNSGAPGAATGITQTGTYFGAVVGPLLFGAIVDATSYRTAWLAAGFMSLGAALAVRAGRRALISDRDRKQGSVLEPSPHTSFESRPSQ